MSEISSYEKRFEKLKHKWEQDEDSLFAEDFYAITNEMESEKMGLTDRVFEHPKYKYRESLDVPESIELGKLERLEEAIDRFVKKRFYGNNN